MDNFTRNLLTEWRKLKISVADKIFIVAVSGGADSVSLLLGLNELRKLKKLDLRFVVAHFNHDLRGEDSEADERFVKKLASDFQFELAFKKEKISDAGNLEQFARRARYEFLAEIAANLHAEAVLTAHTMNDQAETFLLNLVRGAGLEGLGAMKSVRIFESEFAGIEPDKKSSFDEQFAFKIVRPLLSWAKRKDTENFCHLNNIEFRYDTMNEDLAFKRVRIRKVLLPLLEDFNPKIIENLARTAFLLQKDFTALKNLSANFGSESEITRGSSIAAKENLRLKDLRNLFPSICRQILREWLKQKRGNLRRIEKQHFEAIENLISSRKSGKKVELPGGEAVLKEKGNLIFVKNKG